MKRTSSEQGMEEQQQSAQAPQPGGGRGKKPFVKAAPVLDTPLKVRFHGYSQQYDAINDRHERLVKISRDVTVGSKRFIFLLHRLTGESGDVLTREADPALKELIVECIAPLIAELGEGAASGASDQFRRAFSPGLQEFIESITFYEFVTSGQLASPQRIQELIQQYHPTHQSIRITLSDYLLGVSDLSGELMRLCVNSVPKGKFDLCRQIYAFLQKLYLRSSEYPEYLVGKDWPKKVEVMGQSLAKVEQIVLALQLRGQEYPAHVLAAYFESMDQRSASSGGTDST